MNDTIDKKQHAAVLRKEYFLRNDAYQKLLKTSATDLRDNGELYYGKYLGFDKQRGYVLIKLSSQRAFPRKGEILQGLVPSTKHDKPSIWGNLTYEQLWQSSPRRSEFSPIWFGRTDDGNVMVGCRIYSESFKENLPAGNAIILGPAKPPLEYLDNLKFLVENATAYPRFDETISMKLSGASWNPEVLDNKEDTPLQLSVDLQVQRDIVIQGPPGTGKSYLIAGLTALYSQQGKTVLITALTNKSLTEIIEKEGLQLAYLANKIYKTSLSLDEQKEYPNLQPHTDFSRASGSILLSSYYHLADRAKDASGATFDLVIVEEASQAYLSTIGAARHLGQQVLIVGDQNQLSPLRMVNSSDLEHPNLFLAFEGLQAYCHFFKSAEQYLLYKSFRLKSHSVTLTNSFYDDKLIAASNTQDRTVSAIKVNMLSGNKTPKNGLITVLEQYKHVKESRKKGDVIAILTFYKATVKQLRSLFFTEFGIDKNVIIETIDRIQGLTVDECIFFIPNTGLHYSLNPNRFNVATSRSKNTTTIILPDDVNFDGVDDRVNEYFNRLNLS